MKKFAMWIIGIALLTSSALHAQDISGNWQGTLQVGKGLRTVLKISKEDTQLKAVMYNIDQGGQQQVTAIAVQGNAVTFSIKPIDVTYSGTLSADGKSITGKATQAGNESELDLTRVSAEELWPIPEKPKSMPADANPGFEVVTIKPSNPDQPGKYFTVRGRHIITVNTTMNDLVTFAYSLHVKQLVDAPAWFATDKFDLDGIPDVDGQPSTDQLKMLIQKAVRERFKLTFHREQRELSVYALTLAKGGPKMTVTADKPTDGKNFGFRGLGQLTVSNSSMQDFANGMQAAVMDKPVVDHTGLTDRYDFQLKWTADESQFASMGIKVPTPNADDPNAPPSLYTALQEQLGLKMESTKAPAPAFVIDHVEKPSAN
jgi:uncharacterized protein (TIGR03435 family)